MTANTQALLELARGEASRSAYGPLITALADDLEIEAMDRVHAEEALRHYGIPEPTTTNNGDALSEHYEDTLKVTANIDTVGIISLTLPVHPADEHGTPDLDRAFNLALNITESAIELAAHDEAEAELDARTLSPRATAVEILRLMDADV